MKELERLMEAGVHQTALHLADVALLATNKASQVLLGPSLYHPHLADVFPYPKFHGPAFCGARRERRRAQV